MKAQRKFETIYREMKHYPAFASGDEEIKYNCFMNELIVDAERVTEYDETKFNKTFNFYLMSYRWNAQQRDINNCDGQSTKQFLEKVYDNYFAPKPQ